MNYIDELVTGDATVALEAFDTDIQLSLAVACDDRT